MSILKKIAVWLDPDSYATITSLEDRLEAQADAAREMREVMAAKDNVIAIRDGEIAIYKRANADLSEKLANAATQIGNDVAFKRDVREALRSLKDYIMDDVEAAKKKLEAFGSKSSAKREAAAIELAVVNEDLKLIESFIAETK